MLRLLAHLVKNVCLIRLHSPDEQRP